MRNKLTVPALALIAVITSLGGVAAGATAQADLTALPQSAAPVIRAAAAVPLPDTSRWKPLTELSDGFNQDTLSDKWYHGNVNVAAGKKAFRYCRKDPDLAYRRNFTYSDPAAIRMTGRYLILKAERIKDCPSSPDVWRSGHLRSVAKTPVDRPLRPIMFTARIKMPRSKGNIAGFWVRGAYEVDIMESWGLRTARWSGLGVTWHRPIAKDQLETMRADNIRPSNETMSSIGVPGWAQDAQHGRFRNYSGLWEPGTGWTFWVDGKFIGRLPARAARMTDPMEVIVSNLVGDGVPVTPISATANQMVIDWIKVKQEPAPGEPIPSDPDPTDPPTPDPTDPPAPEPTEPPAPEPTPVDHTGQTWVMTNQRGGLGDRVTYFGTRGDIPVTGDWDGDGRQTPGVFRPGTATWFLSNNFNGVLAQTIAFGNVGDLPVAGDFDGDGKDSIGLFRPSTETWYFDNNLDGVPDRTATYGVPGDKPVVGDWDGNGTDTPGVVRGDFWYLSNGFGGVTWAKFPFGVASDLPVSGDWNQDKRDTPGVFRNGTWFVTNSPAATTDATYLYGAPGDQPLVGDFNGDNVDSFMVHR